MIGMDGMHRMAGLLLSGMGTGGLKICAAVEVELGK
jgi:hypothetical protein